MDSTHWPLFGLRLRTPRLTLRLPTLEDLEQLGDVAADGIHDPGQMPFGVPWTDVTPQERARATMQYQWGQWSRWVPTNWTCELAALLEGRPIGLQGVGATDFAIVREVHSGSWLGRRYQGQGLGTEMRAAVVHLAFAGLGAEYVTSEAFYDDAASLAVSRKLGYEPDGIARQSRRGTGVTMQRLRLSRAKWEATRTAPVTIEGLAPCLPLFGLGPDRAADQARV